jgi:hypothetical protein
MPVGITLTPLFRQGCFDADAMNAINTNLGLANNTAPGIVGTSINNSALAFGSFNAAVTILAASHPAGTYRVSVYAVVTTTITVATSWALAITYTDDQAARTNTITTSATMTAGAIEGASSLIRSTGATAIAANLVAASAGAGAVAYSVVLERII